MCQPFFFRAIEPAASKYILIHMNTNGKLIAILIVVIVVAGFFYKVGLLGVKLPNQDSGNQVACTMEAKLCPDGSYVGRTGPKCEFSECPKSTSSGSELPAPKPVLTPKPATSAFSVLTLRQGESGKVLGTTVRVLEVLEDSRCPTDVTCIQAGTVRLRTSVANSLGTSEIVFTLGKPVTAGAEKITLTTVTPEQTSTTKISTAGYQFLFKVEKK